MLACDVSMHAHGGTAAYNRSVCQALVGSCDVTAIARMIQVPVGRPGYSTSEDPASLPDNGPCATRLVGPSAAWRPVLKHLESLISRPRFHAAAERVYAAAMRGSVERAVPADLNVMHFVGTGWDMLGFAAERAARRRGAAFVVTPFVHPGIWGDDRIDMRLYRRADAVLVQSVTEENHLASLGVPADRLRPVGLAPAVPKQAGDGRRFREKHKIGDRPVVLFIGRKQQYKGYHILREAMTDVAVTVPEAVLVVAGPDVEPPYPPLPDEGVRDLGALDWSDAAQAEKADALAACDVFAMPSAAEAFGIVYVEAWSYGKPVVAGPAPAVLELVEDGVTGLHVDQTRESVASALVKLLQDRDLRVRLGVRGQAVQQDRYSWDVIGRKHLDVYRECQEATKTRRGGRRHSYEPDPFGAT